MPSKKKNSKTPLKPANSDQSSVFSSPAAAYSSISSQFDPTQEHLLSSLDEAAARFPSLISSAAVVGTVVDEVVSDFRSCKIWLSESVMVSSSIPPGSLVSVLIFSAMLLIHFLFFSQHPFLGFGLILVLFLRAEDRVVSFL